MAEKQVVVEIRLTAAIAQKRIREIAKNSSSIRWSIHAQERMLERGFVDQDVLRVLRTGHVDDDPTKTEYGEWKCKMTLKIRGGRTAGVIALICPNGKLRIKTVEWEDGK